MSGIKRMMEDREARYQTGLQLCIEAGAIEECENHPGTYFEGEEPVEEAYKLANARITAGKLGMDRREATDAVKEAYDDNAAADGCYECERNFGPD